MALPKSLIKVSGINLFEINTVTRICCMIYAKLTIRIYESRHIHRSQAYCKQISCHVIVFLLRILDRSIPDWIKCKKKKLFQNLWHELVHKPDQARDHDLKSVDS